MARATKPKTAPAVDPPAPETPWGVFNLGAPHNLGGALLTLTGAGWSVPPTADDAAFDTHLGMPGYRVYAPDGREFWACLVDISDVPETLPEPEPAPEPSPPPAPAPVDPVRLNTVSPDKTDLAIIGEHPTGLYLFKGKGYCSHAAGPFLTPATAEALIAAGLCAFEPSGGAFGSIKITAAGRDALNPPAAA